MNLFSCYWHHRSVPTLKEKNIKAPESNEAGEVRDHKIFKELARGNGYHIKASLRMQCEAFLSFGAEGAKDVCTMLAKYSRWIVLVIREIFFPTTVVHDLHQCKRRASTSVCLQ